MKRSAGVLLALSVALFSASAFAQDGDGKPAVQNEVPKDPKGIRGISPAWEAIHRGDAAFLAKDYDGAISEYQAALKTDSKHAMAHYRLGSAFRAKGNLKEASEAFDNAGRFVRDPRLKAKVLFVQADIKEQMKNLADAAEKWTAYITFVDQQHSGVAVVGYAASAEERQAKIEAAKKLNDEYAAVRDRIKARQAEKAAEANKPKS